MTWVNEFLGRVNRKCQNCGKLVLDEPEETRTVNGAEVCSAWCEEYYRAHRDAE
jgi:hypothetical protein